MAQSKKLRKANVTVLNVYKTKPGIFPLELMLLLNSAMFKEIMAIKPDRMKVICSKDIKMSELCPP